MRIFYHDGFKRKVEAKVARFDNMPRSKYNLARTSMIDRLQARKYEYCGATEDLEMHHVRKLKNLKGKLAWEKLHTVHLKEIIAKKERTIQILLNK